jgi:SulP family sulfate permease
LILLFALPRLVKKLPLKASVRAMIPVTLLVILLFSVLHAVFALGGETVTMGETMNSWDDLSGYMLSYIPNFSLITWADIMQALPLAAQLALLGYLDSLLTSLVIDKMTASSTKKNKELVAQ